MSTVNQIDAFSKITASLQALAPIIDQLNLEMDIDLEGEVTKDGFLPSVKAHIKIYRDMDKVIELAKVRFAAAAGSFAKLVTPDVTTTNNGDAKNHTDAKDVEKPTQTQGHNQTQTQNKSDHPVVEVKKP